MSLLASLLTSYEAGLNMRHEVIIGVERRRRWREEEKRSILDEVGVNGASVADVARAHDITRQHIYQWRQELKRKAWLEGPNSSGATFLPVGCPTVESVPDTDELCVEVRLANGRGLKVSPDLCPNKLLKLIRLLEAA